LPILFGENKVDDGSRKCAVKEQHLPINAFGADQAHGDIRYRKAAEDAQQRAAECMSDWSDSTWWSW